MKKLLNAIQNLSLDVTVGAVICSVFMAELLGVTLQVSMLLGLGIAIWLIYTIDHLFDARKSTDDTDNPRHRYHKHNFNSILAVAIIVFVTGLYNLLSLPWITIKYGLILAALVLVYIVSLHLLKLKKTGHKEFLAALIYSFGVFVAPLSLLDTIDTKAIFLFVVFFLVVMTNLLLFPLFEEETDRKDQLQSVVTLLGNTVVRRLSCVFLFLGLGILAWGTFYFKADGNDANWFLACGVFLAMYLVLGSMLIWPDLFKKRQLYRWVGDGIFLLPLIYLSL